MVREFIVVYAPIIVICGSYGVLSFYILSGKNSKRLHEHVIECLIFQVNIRQAYPENRICDVRENLTKLQCNVLSKQTAYSMNSFAQFMGTLIQDGEIELFKICYYQSVDNVRAGIASSTCENIYGARYTSAMKHMFGMPHLVLDPRVERILFFDRFRNRMFMKIIVIATMTELFQYVRHESLTPPHGREYIRSMMHFYETSQLLHIHNHSAT